jgi:hypothetical protein
MKYILGLWHINAKVLPKHKKHVWHIDNDDGARIATFGLVSLRG